MCRFTVVNSGALIEQKNSKKQAEQFELENNITFLENEIRDNCDQLILCIEQRRKDLLKEVEKVKEEKLQNLYYSQHFSHTIGSRKVSNDLNAGNCLRFVKDDKIFGFIKEYGILDEGRASAENSTANGIALKYGIANEKNTFELRTYNNSKEISWVEQDDIVSFLQHGDETFLCSVKNKYNGVYNITYEVPHGGEYELHVQVNGRCINNSHFQCKIFEKQEMRFFNISSEGELKFQGNNSVLVPKTEYIRTTKLYTDVNSSVRAWKVRVTTACPKITLSLGYSNAMATIPDLTEEFYSKIRLQELVKDLSLHQVEYRSEHRHNNPKHEGGHHNRKRLERKQSMYKRESITFVVFQDIVKEKIYVVSENMQIEKHVHFATDTESLSPFIGIKHFCKNPFCPRPMLTFV